MNWLFAIIVGKIGLSLAISAGLFAAWYLLPPIPWLTDRLRRALLMTAIGFAAAPVIYGWGAYDGRASYKAKIEKEITRAVEKGNAAKADALREFDAAPDGVSDDGFSRP